MPFVKYPHIRQPNHKDNEDIFVNRKDKIYITVKMDGANFSFWRDGDDILMASRNNIVWREGKPIGSNWTQYTTHLYGKLVDENGVILIEEGYNYYGEVMKPHTIQYKKPPLFIGFDVLYGTKMGNSFMPYTEAKKKFDALGIPTAPLLYSGEGEPEDVNLYDMIPISEYGGMRDEGIVIKNYNRLNRFGRPLFAKVKSTEFMQKTRRVFVPRVYDKEVGKFLRKYVTDDLINKIVMGYIDNDTHDYVSPEISMMQYLPGDVLMDIMEEHGFNIIREFNILPCREIRKATGQRCKTILLSHH